MTKTFVTGEVLTAADTNTFLVNNGFQFVGTRYYTSSGTFDKADPFGDSSFDGAKLRAIRVRLVGAGGGGGGCAAPGSTQGATGGSAGGGVYAESFITNISGLATTVTLTVGGGGNGGAAGANNGSVGGTSSFGSIVSANGGAFGGGGSAITPVSISAGGADNATVGTGDLVIAGQGSVINVVISKDFASSQLSGGSQFGPGKRQNVSNTNGFAGTFAGTGGCGGNQSGFDGVTARSGGQGGPGLVIVDVFA